MRTLALLALLLTGCTAAGADTPAPKTSPAGGPRPTLGPGEPRVGEKLQLPEAEWKKRLSPERYRVLREKGTERAFTGDLWDEHRAGLYRCAGCGAPLFASADKFESGTGWPSFTRPVEPGRVAVSLDASHGMIREEVVCARCGGHLGHVFDDGPEPTGQRYCMNSAALRFVPASP